MSKVLLKPKDGVKIMNMTTNTVIPATGAYVDLNPYYKRRIQDGDAVVVDPDVSTEKAPAKKSKKGEK